MRQAEFPIFLYISLWWEALSRRQNNFVLMILVRYKEKRQWHPTPVHLPGKSYGRRSLVGWSPWGLEESDTTEWLHFQFSLSCIGEGNGNPLQCSCLENPRDGGAWWAAVSGVAQSRTRLKRLSSSSCSSKHSNTEHFPKETHNKVTGMSIFQTISPRQSDMSFDNIHSIF